MKDYFRELYECKKKLLNELLVIKKVKDALSFSKFELEREIKTLEEDMKSMEVNLDAESEVKE